MKYDLWDTETSNYFGQFKDEKEVLTLVRSLVNRYGEHYAQDLGLGRVTDEGKILSPLSGTALLARVEEVLSDRQHADEPRTVVSGSAVQGRRTVTSN